MNDQTILQNTGSVSNKEMIKHVKKVYDTFDKQRKLHEAKHADLDDLKALEEMIKKTK
jgi:hypothetical protein